MADIMPQSGAPRGPRWPAWLHTPRTLLRYGWRERSSIIGALLVAGGGAVFFTLSRAQIEEYTGRLIAIAGMLAAGVTVGRGVLGIVRNTTDDPPGGTP